jgi:hypothetical protein
MASARVLAAGILAVAVLCGGCGARQPAPIETLHGYSAALRAKDYSAAYDMMSESYQAKHSRDEFVRMMKQSSAEAGDTAQFLSGTYDAQEISAEVTYGVADSIKLVQEHGEWRIASNPLAFYAQSTPREALRSFVRAYKLKRWDVMLRFVPTKWREQMSLDKMREQFDSKQTHDDIERMMNMIEANLDEPITDKGNEARMPYGDRYEVKFVLEDGNWKIQDLD